MDILKTLSLGAFIAISLTTPTHANETAMSVIDAPTIKPLEISTPNDLTLSCGELFQEAMNMTDIMHAAQDIKDSSKMKSHGLTAAGAIGSLLIGTATGGVGLAVGGFLVNHNIEEHSEKADDIQDIAAQRRTLMLGIHQAKECYGPTEYLPTPTKKHGSEPQIAYSDKHAHPAKTRTLYNN